MSPSPGTRLGHYEIVETIGKGGMGEVYRARDTRLPRDAAIKVSAERFSERFAREAHAIASLNHPNITTLYDVGPDYLVMELVEGPTLADRIRQGPLTLDEASAIARQIADALEYAHEKGIVHRDLKPGNVKIRPDGVVKVLDFGLAKSGLSNSASRSDESPTISAHQTEAGVMLGTAAYMAPEQAKGQRGGQARRHLGVRLRVLRDADRHAAAPGRLVAGNDGQHPPRRAGPRQGPGPGASAAEAMSREGSAEASAPHRRRDVAARRAAVGPDGSRCGALRRTRASDRVEQEVAVASRRGRQRRDRRGWRLMRLGAVAIADDGCPGHPLPGRRNRVHEVLLRRRDGRLSRRTMDGVSRHR